MARRRYQQPAPKKRGNAWTLEYREDVEQPDGTVKRARRKAILGYVHQLPTEKLARRAAAKILAKINAASYQPHRPIRFNEFSERWKMSMLSEMKPSSRTSAQSVLRMHLQPKFGDLYLWEITPERVQSFIADLRDKVSEKTAWNVVMTMRSVWRTALDWQYTDERIFDHVRMRSVSPPDDVRCFSLEETQRIISASPEPYRTFYWLAAETGMRAGELCALRWQDVDPRAGIVTVKRSVWRGKFTDTKSRRARRFAISQQIIERLEEMRSIRKPLTDLIFQSSRGTPWDSNMLVKRKLQPLLERLGIQRAGMHAFRHFNGSEMSRLLAPGAGARDRLGHSSLVVTNRYTHSVSADDHAIAGRLARSIISSQLTPM
ncbi:MAG TPA: tyrosine-type recombinase/integrase [Terriglobia bacterium]|nr:tyrosine-type recombinase/integrase [Terriglobia bacterium]